MSIVAEGVTKLYGTQRALDGISFEVRRGSITGFLGPNGAGKSTMMKIITGYLPASEGVVTIDGVEVGPDNIELKRRIGYLPENNPLYPDMYIREYLAFVASLYLPRGERRRAVENIAGITGLLPEIGKKIGELSKGYRQRVGLAQALIHDPDVLILDEATTGLDPNQIVEIRNLILSAGREKTVMISTHIMQEVEAICDRVIIIDKGSIVADDSTSAITSLLSGASEALVVEFDPLPSVEALQEIHGVTGVTVMANGEFVLTSADGNAVRSRLPAWSVANNHTIVSLRSHKSTLEEVFRHLTGPAK